jgi:hypothetical protein
MKRATAAGRSDVEMNVKPRLTALNKLREISMRATASLVFVVSALLMSWPAFGQTYDPRYAVCLQVYDNMGGYISCGYMSMEQCRLSAQARAAECIVNPYFAGRAGNGRIRRR